MALRRDAGRLRREPARHRRRLGVSDTRSSGLSTSNCDAIRGNVDVALAVKRPQYRHHRALNRALAPLGLSLVQWDVLAMGSEHHTFHVHGHRWRDPNGVPVDTATVGPAAPNVVRTRVLPPR